MEDISEAFRDLVEKALAMESELEEAGVDFKELDHQSAWDGQEDTIQVEEVAPVEEKRASTIAGKVEELASASGERTRAILQAIATLVRVAKGSEFAALASILLRVVPKGLREEAEGIAAKLAREAGEYQAPVYPSPESKELADLAKQVAELRAAVDEIRAAAGRADEKAEKALSALSSVPQAAGVSARVYPASILAGIKR